MGLTLTPLCHRDHAVLRRVCGGALTPLGWDGRKVPTGSSLCWEQVAPEQEALVPISRLRGGRGSESHAARPALRLVLGRGARKAFPLWVRDLRPLQGRDHHKGAEGSHVLSDGKSHQIPRASVMAAPHSAPPGSLRHSDVQCADVLALAVPTPPPAPQDPEPSPGRSLWVQAAAPQPPLLSGPHRAAAG